MIRYSRNFQTPNTLNPLKSSKISFNNFLLGVIALNLLGVGCSGPTLHSDLREDLKVLIRKATLSTHGPFEMGDHGTEYSNPVVVENAIIFGNRSVGLVSFYPSLNQQRWVLPIRGGVMSELSVDQNNVYFGGGDGFLYSVNLENGKVNWRYEIRNPIISKPTLAKNRVFITTSDDTIYAFDAGTGKWLWHYRRRSSQLATIFGASEPLVDGNEVLAGLSDGFLVALSLEEGQLRWERKLHQGTKFTNVNAHPVLEKELLYIPSYDGALYCLKRNAGEVVWRFDTGGSKNVVIDDQSLYLPASNGVIYSLDKNSAKIQWKFELDRGTPTQLALTPQYVIVGSSYQYLYVIEKKTGKGLYRFDVGYGSGFSGSPAFDPDTQRLYILSASGNLYTFALRQPPKKIRAHGSSDPYLF